MKVALGELDHHDERLALGVGRRVGAPEKEPGPRHGLEHRGQRASASSGGTEHRCVGPVRVVGQDQRTGGEPHVPAGETRLERPDRCCADTLEDARGDLPGADVMGQSDRSPTSACVGVAGGPLEAGAYQFVVDSKERAGERDIGGPTMLRSRAMGAARGRARRRPGRRRGRADDERQTGQHHRRCHSATGTVSTRKPFPRARGRHGWERSQLIRDAQVLLLCAQV